MAHIFTGGLIEKIKKTRAEAPEELIKAITNLRTYPSSGRICREAIALANSILNKEVRPLPFITKRAVVSFGEGTPSEICVEYRKERKIPLSLNCGYCFADSYRFYNVNKGDAEEICINREGGFFLFQYAGERYDREKKTSTITMELAPSRDSMHPAGVEILKNNEIVEDYFIKN